MPVLSFPIRYAFGAGCATTATAPATSTTAAMAKRASIDFTLVALQQGGSNRARGRLASHRKIVINRTVTARQIAPATQCYPGGAVAAGGRMGSRRLRSRTAGPWPAAIADTIDDRRRKR